ncbi:3-oxo-Delta(4,5)-steroid 5-beta-reductase [Quercus suber]|uniref:3-oxo-Delta(4,5)-steroid 5-beta-reductase n=1 Tax=Quercus suber TaxID=58331 RepID=A0AAW0KT79_QUESU
MEQEVPNTNTPVALVVGVTGMVGLSLAEALKSPTALGGPWKVYGSARRPKPTWFPSFTPDHYITFDALDFDDTLKHLAPIAHEITHVFWVAIQVRENEESNIVANSTMLENVIKALKSATSSRLCHITLQTGTKHYMGPIFDPVLGTQLVHHEPPFHEDMPRLPYPNFHYALEDLLASYSPSLSYSVHRSSIIVGASSRSFYNALLTLCSLWKVCCEVFDVEFVPFDENEKFDWVGMMKKKGRVWDEIVEKYGLYQTKMEEIVCPEAFDTVLHFDFPHVCSMNKSREFGFFGYANTLKSIGLWVRRLRDMKIIP